MSQGSLLAAYVIASITTVCLLLLLADAANGLWGGNNWDPPTPIYGILTALVTGVLHYRDLRRRRKDKSREERDDGG